MTTMDWTRAGKYFLLVDFLKATYGAADYWQQPPAGAA